MTVTNDAARPKRKRAWTKKDQAARLKKIPVLLCEPTRNPNCDGAWLGRAWCPFCHAYHHHGATPGHRGGHCTSPQPKTGYVLRLDPRFKDLDALTSTNGALKNYGNKGSPSWRGLLPKNYQRRIHFRKFPGGPNHDA